MQCPVCEYPYVKPRYSMKDRFFRVTDESFLLHHCSSCGLLFQEEEAVRGRLADFYPPGYWWKQNGPLSALERRYREWMVRKDQLSFIQSELKVAAQGRLLDIGCGSGTFVKIARKAGLDARGVEMSPEAVRIAEQEVPGQIHCGTEQDLIEQGNLFDVVTLFHVLEHVPEPFQYLKTIQKLLSRPGALVVQVPNVWSFQAQMFGSRWYGLDCPRHLYNYSSFSILHLLGRAGYRIQKVRHFSLRDNAATFASSLLPSLDPMSQRVRKLQKTGRLSSFGSTVRSLLYFNVLALAQPFSFLEAKLGRGATITVLATLE